MASPQIEGPDHGLTMEGSSARATLLIFRSMLLGAWAEPMTDSTSRLPQHHAGTAALADPLA